MENLIYCSTVTHCVFSPFKLDVLLHSAVTPQGLSLEHVLLGDHFNQIHVKESMYHMKHTDAQTKIFFCVAWWLQSGTIRQDWTI